MAGLMSDAITIVGGGVSYEVQASSNYPAKGIGDIRFNSNVGTPLARWVDESLRTLEPCWRKKRPEHSK